jgi:hypothetical protein
MTSAEAQRIAKALESIAASLEKIANPLVVVPKAPIGDPAPTIRWSNPADHTKGRW